MIKLLKNAEVYAPAHLGKRDILVAGEKIMAMGHDLRCYEGLPGVETHDIAGAVTVPGFIDLHIHIIGGGGEQGPTSRVPEIQLSRLTLNGITTVLGLLGTDSVTRSQEALVAKSRALTEEGITCYCLAGAYQFPSSSLLGGITRDIVLIDPIVGVKVALADHRSSTLSLNELTRLGSDARLGGILSGKAGIVVIHMGLGKQGMNLLFEAIERSDIPIKTFLPTHCGRNEFLAGHAVRFIQMGGTADFTADIDYSKGTAAKMISWAIRQGADSSGITLSSDAQGSDPVFDRNGNCIGMEVGMPILLGEISHMVESCGISLETALSIVTKNPARVLGKTGVKGELKEGADADIVVLDGSLSVKHVFARGRLMVWDGQAKVKGKFEI